MWSNTDVLCSICFPRLDYAGIAIFIMGSFIPPLYYGFYCSRVLKIVYMSMICSLGVICIIVSLWDKFSAPHYRLLRAGKYVVKSSINRAVFNCMSLNQNNHSDQSKQRFTSSLADENSKWKQAGKRDCFSFASDWLNDGTSFFRPITEQSWVKPMQSWITFDTPLKIYKTHASLLCHDLSLKWTLHWKLLIFNFYGNLN